VPERIFLMFDYTSSGLWYASEDGSARASGMVDPERLPISRVTKQRLAAWVTAHDELSKREFASGAGPAPTEAEWEAVEAERVALWQALRREAGPDWEIGLRTGEDISWPGQDEASSAGR
jgi:hypothetical protein